jgi:hypothetical protein
VAKTKAVESKVAELVFPRHLHTNVYLHPGRVGDAFVGDQGAIAAFEKSVQRAGKGSAEANAIFVRATMGLDITGGTTITYDLARPLAQALVLRAGMVVDGRLHTGIRHAPIMSLVLAEGTGGIGGQLTEASDTLESLKAPPPTVVTEILAEFARRMTYFRPDDPPGPMYWPALSRTSSGLAVAFLGGAELNHSNAVNWIGTEVKCCIFGRKLRDWEGWTMIEPFHVWLEEP